MPFDLQGHRGARGLKPENTLPGFEAALDLMVSSLETDLHLTKDGVPVLSHDEAVSEKLARIVGKNAVPAPDKRPRISGLTLEQLRCYAVDRNPEPERFPRQDNQPTPVAEAFAKQHGFPIYTLPTVADLIAFVDAYAGELGKKAGKTELQRSRARQVRFALELKRVPFRPEHIGDVFDGDLEGEFERKVIELVRKAGVVERTTFQCFDHRAIRAARKLEPKLTGAALISNTAPVSIPQLMEAATAQVYSPEFTFLDVRQVRQAQEAKVRVIPYTINEIDDMKRLLDWGVDGIITDYPNRLVPLLQARHMQF